MVRDGSGHARECGEPGADGWRMVGRDQPGRDDVQQLDHHDLGAGGAERADDVVELDRDLFLVEGTVQRVVAAGGDDRQVGPEGNGGGELVLADLARQQSAVGEVQDLGAWQGLGDAVDPGEVAVARMWLADARGDAVTEHGQALEGHDRRSSRTSQQAAMATPSAAALQKKYTWVYGPMSPSAPPVSTAARTASPSAPPTWRAV